MTHDIYLKISRLIKNKGEKIKFAIYPCGKRGREVSIFIKKYFKIQDIVFIDNKNIFFDYDSWSHFMRQNDFTFAFGTRFHGNMMALNHGISTLYLVHDWRTRELVEYLKLPHLELNGTFQKIKYPEELMEYCDYTEVYKNYGVLYKRYCEFIEKNLG